MANNKDNLTKQTFEDGLEIHTRTRHYYSGRPSKGRVYISLPDFAPEPTEKCTDEDCPSAWCQSARANGKPEHTEVDHKAWRRWLRSEIKLTKERVIPALEVHFGCPIDPSQLRFSAKAGCSCGCSPGFIIDGTGGRTWNVDTWVNVATSLGPASILASNIAAIAREVSSLTRV
jgi:hypothetical protein